MFRNYTHLPAGNYIFRVQGTNNNGLWSKQEAVLKITILPPWWETVWFRVAVLLAVVGLLLAIYRWRVWQIEQRNRELETQVAAQTQEILQEVSERQQAEIRLATMEERERIGRELHDDLGQVMGYVSVQTQALEDFLTQGQTDRVQAILQQLKTVAQEAHDDVRKYILGIRTGVPRLAPDFFVALHEYLAQLRQRYGLDVRTSWPDDLLDTSLAPEVETQLLRIIQEALTNVRKHAGVQSAHLLFTLHPNDIQVVISDEGRGFVPSPNPSQREEDDMRSPPEGRPNAGHFGLDIMRERAESVGGSLEIRSKPEQGTQVIVRLPQVLDVPPDKEVRGLRALVVDDHPLYVEGLRNLLSTRGVHVVGAAHDGLEAQELAHKLLPDLILMDVEMPRCNGLEATRRIKAELPDIKIVMLTVVADDETLPCLKPSKAGPLATCSKAWRASNSSTCWPRLCRAKRCCRPPWPVRFSMPLPGKKPPPPPRTRNHPLP